MFLFKQKTAYEMRISDWSSDVCSSDLGRARDGRIAPQRHGAAARYLLFKGAFSYAISDGPARCEHEVPAGPHQADARREECIAKALDTLRRREKVAEQADADRKSVV